MKQGLWVLAALALGVMIGAFVRASDHAALSAGFHAVSVVGTLWLDALRMTLAPLIFALLVSAIVSVAETAAAGRLARRALGLFAVLLLVAATYSVLATTFALRLAPLDPASAAALTRAVDAPAPSAQLDIARWLESLIPTNVVAAAAEDAVLPLVVFAVVFGFAVTRIESPRRAALAGFFQALADTMLVIIKWVLALAPAGVFGLALALGLDTGFDAVGAIAHYVGLVVGVTCGIIVAAIAIAIAGSGMHPLATLRALAPAQVIAASTQSSLASLPAMLQTALGPLKIRAEIAEFVLPLAVAVFRLTSPVANLAVAVFVVHLSGADPGPMQYAAAIVVAFLVSISSVGLPGQSSFFVSVAPICMVLGAPTAVLPLLLAVEVIPDIFRTVGNVTGDLAAAVTLNRAERSRTHHRSSG